MLVECECLGNIQAAETILKGSNNTLHLDGIHNRFNEYSAFEVTTSDGSKGLSLELKVYPWDLKICLLVVVLIICMLQRICFLN